jgi:hypothetical protein
MPKRKFAKVFLKKAREKGSEDHKYTLVTGEEVKKTLEYYTLKRYRRMIEIWN